MKRVTILTPGLGLGGAEVWIRALVSGCKDFEWTVGTQPTKHDHPLIVSAISKHSKIVARGSLPEAAAAASKNADAVIAWGIGNYWPIPTRAPVVFVGHGSCQWTLTATAWALEGGARHFVGVSSQAAEAMRALVPNVHVLLNGVDTGRLIVPDDRYAIRKHWRPHGNDYDKYVGYMGRMSEEKNVDSVINAVASMPFHYKLVLIGCTGLSRDRMLGLARTVLSARVIEVPATDDIGVPLGGLDCMVQVSPREGHSLALCEAWLCGVPVISNMTGAVPELSRMAGFDLVERVPDDPLTNEVAEAIRRVCLTPPSERVAKAQAFAQEHLTAEVMCRKWTAFLHGIIGGRGIPGCAKALAGIDL